MKRNEMVRSLKIHMEQSLNDFFTFEEASETLRFLECLGMLPPTLESLVIDEYGNKTGWKICNWEPEDHELDDNGMRLDGN